MASRFSGALNTYPARAAVGWYLGLIAVGTLVLMHPACMAEDEPPLTFVDSLFTATSAACVTGLSVRSTGEDFSLLGQLVILTLIQLGGVGIMTVTTFAMLSLGRRESLRQRMLVAGTVGATRDTDLKSLLIGVLRFVVVMEGTGFVLLTAGFALHTLTSPDAHMLTTAEGWAFLLYDALFHSVSAFCNAGFSLYDDSLMRYRTDPIVCLTMAGLIIVGGVGFPVILEFTRGSVPWFRRWERSSVHGKIMLVGTILLLIAGTVCFLILEWDNALEEYGWGTKLLISFFHSTTCRTAGFNTVDMTALTLGSLVVTMALMVIGGGPCSTAGGIKVSSFSVLVLHAWSRFRGADHITVFRRTVPRETVERSIAAVGLFSTFTFLGVLVIVGAEHSDLSYRLTSNAFVELVFEAVSALGTVGLSTGLTAQLSQLSKLALVGLMFVGRLGPISVFIAFSRQERNQRLEYASEELLVG